MTALIDWVETLRDVWVGFVAEVVLDPSAKPMTAEQARVLGDAVASSQAGYVMSKIVFPAETGIDPADFTSASWRAALERWESGDFSEIMVLGSWPDAPGDFVVVSLVWQERGLFRIEGSSRYAREIDKWAGSIQSLVDVLVRAYATCGGISGWANLAVAGESNQAQEIARLVGKWQRKSKVTLVDLTPPGEAEAPVQAHLPAACWLTLLSPDMVASLGGLEAVESALPEDIRLEMFEDGGLLVQLTPTPLADESPETEGKYQALGALLAPIVAQGTASPSRKG
jgi:hypothetical protein